jgi:hypothetical protein
MERQLSTLNRYSAVSTSGSAEEEYWMRRRWRAGSPLAPWPGSWLSGYS